jgi:hypothetical protein
VKTRQEHIEDVRREASYRIKTVSKVMPVISEVQTELLLALCVEMYFQGRVDAALEIVSGN